jgi:fermentation-respiration switch protein FrsA (DUF1100 family)
VLLLKAVSRGRPLLADRGRSRQPYPPKAIGRALTGVALRAVRPLDAATRLGERSRPCLLIHSAGDRFIPAGDARRLADASGGELWITDSQGHIGSYRAEPVAYTSRVLGFFARHLA